MDLPGNWTEIYMREFNYSYNGNRAPLGIFIHTGAGLMATPEHAGQARQGSQTLKQGKDCHCFIAATNRAHRTCHSIILPA